MAEPKRERVLPVPVNEGVMEDELGTWVFVVFEVLEDWHVTFRTLLYNRAISGPIEMSIKLFDRPGALDNPSVRDGVTTHVLRAIPMRHARKRLEELAVAEYRRTNHEDFPERFTTEEDFAQLAYIFVTMANRGDPNPVRALALEHGKPRNTVAVRIRRAQSLGLLTPEGEPPALTAKAEEILGLERSDG